MPGGNINIFSDAAPDNNTQAGPNVPNVSVTSTAGAITSQLITSNNIDLRPGIERDDQFQLNLDGQQITQKVASSTFGQPKFSREAIAEFQIVTNLFDITQGRSTGAQVQAISKSGTNTMAGSVYGYFRNDKFNAADQAPTEARKPLPAIVPAAQPNFKILHSFAGENPCDRAVGDCQIRAIGRIQVKCCGKTLEAVQARGSAGITKDSQCRLIPAQRVGA